MSDQPERAHAVMNILSENFSEEMPIYSMLHEIRERVKPMTDHGTSMDTGAGFGAADMWFTVGGVEYFMQIKRSRAQIEKSGPSAS